MILISFVTSTLSSIANTNTTLLPDTIVLNNFLKKTVDSYRIPGLAIAMVNDKRVIYKSVYGKFSTQENITQNTPFLLGSTTKMFTALAIMRLVETGKVCIDSTVKNYLPEFKLASPEYENTITIRHLLNHTSGLSSAGMPHTPLGENSLMDELILLRQCKPVSSPGKKYEYFNDNYRLLGLVIEKTSGMKYGEYLYSEIFKPLGMISTFADPDGVENLAPGHGGILGFPFKRKQKYRAGALPSGYIVSSVTDVANLLIDELRASKNDASILNPKIVKMTWQPPQDIEGGYAMGWMVFDNKAKTPFLAHGGSLENYQSFFYINPELSIGFVFLLNQGGLLPMIGGFNTLRNGLIKIIDKEQPENGSGQWPVILVLACFLLIVALNIYMLFRLKTWRIRAEQKKKWKKWAVILFDYGFFFFLVFLLNKDGYMLYNMLPELFLLLWIMIILGFVRSLVKTWIVIKNPRVLFY